MKDRKSFKNSGNAMEQELSFQKGLQKKTETKTKTKTETNTKTKTKTETNTKTKIKTKTTTKNEKDRTCAIFPESRGCKDIKYDNFTKMTKKKKKTKTETNKVKTQHVLYFRKAKIARISIFEKSYHIRKFCQKF